MNFCLKCVYMASFWAEIKSLLYVLVVYSEKQHTTADFGNPSWMELESLFIICLTWAVPLNPKLKYMNPVHADMHCFLISTLECTPIYQLSNNCLFRQKHPVLFSLLPCLQQIPPPPPPLFHYFRICWRVIIDFRGFNPGRSRRIFQGEKILSTSSFGREVKPFVPRRRFTECKRSLNVTWKSGIPRPSSSSFHY